MTPHRPSSWLMLLWTVLCIHQCIPINGAQETTSTDATPLREVVLSSPPGIASDHRAPSALTSSSRADFRLPSLAALHENLKDLVRRGEVIPARCHAVSVEATLWSRCAQLSQADKTYLAVAFTECHFDLYTHKYKDDELRSCQDIQDEREMGECVKDMNTNDVFPIFIQFKTTLQSLCQEIDHSFQFRRSHAALDKVLDATLLTAQSLTQLRDGTETLGREVHHQMEQSSSVLIDLLSSHTKAEAARFDALNSAASRLEHGQDEMHDKLKKQSTNLRDLLSDSHSLQTLINATSLDIARTQQDILEIQTSTSLTLGETKDELLDLKGQQKKYFEDTLLGLQTLKALSDELSSAQEASHVSIRALTDAQDQAFQKASNELEKLSDGQQQAASEITKLHADQRAAFESAANQLGTITTLQRDLTQAQTQVLQAVKDAETELNGIKNMQSDISSSQSTLLNSVRESEQELKSLSANQREAFVTTGASLEKIQEQALEVERKLSGLLLEVKAAIDQLFNLNMQVLNELFQINSTVFYLLLIPLSYFATATERTKRVRFWIFLFLISTLLLELNLVSAAQRFQYQLSQMEYDTLRMKLRYTLSIVSLGLVILSAMTYKDYMALNYELHQQNTHVIHNNHRMLHELLRRTEHFSPSASSTNSSTTGEFSFTPKYESNPFQQGHRPATYFNTKKENPANEGRRPLAIDNMPDLDGPTPPPTWHGMRTQGPDACCPDQRPQPSTVGRMFSAVFNWNQSAPSTATSSSPAATTGFKRESSPPSTTSSHRHTTFLPSTFSRPEGSSHAEGADSDDEDTAAETNSRVTRSRSRSRAPSSSASKRTPSKGRPSSSVKEDNTYEDDEEEDAQPGATAAASSKKKPGRRS